MNLYQSYLSKTGEVGEVAQVKNPLILVKGIPGAKLQEMVYFESGGVGQIFSVDEELVEVLLLNNVAVKVGDRLSRSNVCLSIGVGEELLGKVVSPLAENLSRKAKPIELKESRVVEKECEGMLSRTKISRQLVTGVLLADLLIPLAKGQKELVIGDKKTGKTAFVLNACKSQISEGSMVVYCAIGKGTADIRKLENYFIKEKLFDRAVIVAAYSNDPPGLVYLAPYAAITMAEYFRDKGKDVLLVYDDLSTHAKYYREISLAARRFPGRESYPGDIFFSHARILERAGNFKKGKGEEVSITCLPVAETVEGDLTGYIATNLMSMTDGHMFFDSSLYYQGQRPAININLSVTRVGRQVQSSLKKDINQKLLSFMVTFEHIQNYSRFGAEMSPEIKETISKGEKIKLLFHQSQSQKVSEAVQLTLFGLVWLGVFADTKDETLILAKANLNEACDKGKLQLFSDAYLKAKSVKDFMLLIKKDRSNLVGLCRINDK